VKIKIRGVIVSNDYKWIYEWFDMEATSPGDVEKIIEEADGEDLEVEINSGGGEVYAGSEIYTLLKGYKGNVLVSILGIAASAASVIAMAGKTVSISPTAQIMVHNVSSGARGDYRALQHEADVIKNYNKSIANAYMLKTGMKQDELLKLMDDETWLNAQQAKEMGFADEIMFDDQTLLVASLNSSALLPMEVINKVRNLIKNNPESELLINNSDPVPDQDPEPGTPPPNPDPPGDKQTDKKDLLFLLQRKIQTNKNKIRR